MNKKTFETELMISNASGLRYVASELNCKYPASLEKSDMDISTGYFQAAPVLWALGIEIALKAWICRETNREPPKSHDLLNYYRNWIQRRRNYLKMLGNAVVEKEPMMILLLIWHASQELERTFLIPVHAI